MTRRTPERLPPDWDAVYTQVARSAATKTPEQVRAILDARARKLAARPAPAARDQLALAVFQLAGERYAIELGWIHEVARLTDYTPVPGTPDYVIGLTSLRGEIVAVIDLRRLFGLAIAGLGEQSRLVVIGERHGELGVLVDTTLGTVALTTADLLAAPTGVVRAAQACVRGVTADAMIVLDGKALLADPRLVIDQRKEPDR